KHGQGADVDEFERQGFGGEGHHGFRRFEVKRFLAQTSYKYGDLVTFHNDWDKSTCNTFLIIYATENQLNSFNPSQTLPYSVRHSPLLRPGSRQHRHWLPNASASNYRRRQRHVQRLSFASGRFQ